MNEQISRKKKLRIRYRLSIVFFVTVLIFGLIFYRYMKTVTLEEVLSQNRTITFFTDSKDDPDGGNISTEESGDSSAEQGGEPDEIVNPVPESEKADSSYLDDCVFIGDSLTYGLSSYGVVPSSNVLASVSMSIAKVETEEIDTQYGLMTIVNALTEMNPKKIYVMLGSIGAAYLSAEDMYQKYQSFLNKASLACPDADIYIISTPPVTKNKEDSQESPIKNSVIDELNSKLLEYADNNGAYYVDTASALKGSDGCLPADYAENDGMHFKYSTYELFVDYILTHTGQ